MNKIYHIVPPDFKEDTLYPLNMLKEKNPEAYVLHAKKYEQRKHITELYIPQLDCYWGDVVHMAAVHPNKIVSALKEAGFDEQFSYYEIDANLLDHKKTIIYSNKVKEDKNHLTKDDFAPFDAAKIEGWDYIPQETIDYYKRKFSEGKKPIPFLFVPHILYKGSLDVKGLDLHTTS